MFFIFLICFYVSSINAINIAITIDDYPLPDNKIFSVKDRAQKFIDVAAKHKCKFVFFCVGQHIDDRNDASLLKVLNEHGHFIANHSMNHKHTSSLSLDKFKEEIQEAEKRMASYSLYKKWFRYPYLDYGSIERLWRIAQQTQRELYRFRMYKLCRRLCDHQYL